MWYSISLRANYETVGRADASQIPKPSEKEGLGIEWPAGETDMERLKGVFEEIKAKM